MPDPMNLYDPRHTTGITPLHGKPGNGTSLKGLLIRLGFLLVLLAGAIWLFLW
ncbi:MAG: hypothetical protein O2788_00180 [Chloroflexi bacterium]|nr:hypothetical protein [Chloroflexota bacterium]